MRRLLIAAVIAFAGCSKAQKVSVELTDVPEKAMRTVREKMPEATLTAAWIKPDGTYEVRGKLKSGKIREVEVKADGTFVDME
jgi:hypothetical protein